MDQEVLILSRTTKGSTAIPRQETLQQPEDILQPEEQIQQAPIQEVKVQTAGNLQYFLHEWKKITDDKFVLNCIQGYKIDFAYKVVQKSSPVVSQRSNTEVKILSDAIFKLLKKKAIRPCKPTSGQFVSTYFTVPKPDGSHRFILNLKKLNKFIVTEHFKLEDLRAAMKLVMQGDFMASIDLEDAYFAIPIHRDYCKFLRFEFQGQLYEFLVLPFGLATSPFVFTKVMKPIVNYLRSKGYKSVIYLDDILCIGKNFDSCKQNLKATENLLLRLGFTISYKKSQLIPSTSCKFLGFIIDSLLYQIKPTVDKVGKVSIMINKMLTKRSCSVREFANFIGTLVSLCPAAAYGFAHTKILEREKCLALILCGNNYDSQMSIPNSVHPEIVWWRKNLNSLCNPIRTFKFEAEIFTDSSLEGWGAVCGSETAHGTWSEKEKKRHINYLELVAVYKALLSLAKDFENCEILLRIDNTTALSYVNRMGGIKYTSFNVIAKQIWKWAEERNIWLYASYVKSSQNTVADALSRVNNTDTEWEISDLAYKDIVHQFGKPNIDLFASHSNFKCKRYVSWYQDRKAEAIDAFTLDWSRYGLFYAFPPFSMILRTLNKIKIDKATGIVVVPFWSAQTWFPLFLEMTVGRYIVFKPDKYLLSSSFRKTHPLHQHLSLIAAKLTGKV